MPGAMVGVGVSLVEHIALVVIVLHFAWKFW
jgi:hypothetical protein